MTASASINYVVAAYFGSKRLHAGAAYAEDGSVFLRHHIESLERLPHELAQVTVVISDDDASEDISLLDVGAKVAAIRRQLPERVGDTKVEVIWRQNRGFSYGAYAAVFAHYGQAFSHYILTEDDYLFTQPNFDRILLERCTGKIGMLCGAKAGLSVDTAPHAAVAVALCSSEALAAAAQAFPRGEGEAPKGLLPYSRLHGDYRDGYYGQKAQSFAIVEAGWEIEDWCLGGQWACAYWDSAPGIVRWFSRCHDLVSLEAYQQTGNLDVPSFVVPVQVLGRQVRISTGDLWHDANIRADGTVEKV